jgi:hypothetical protein
MPDFAIPGLMPTQHPKWDFKKTANSDGSFNMVVYETSDQDEVLPFVRFYILWQCNHQLAVDESSSTVFLINEGTVRKLEIRIEPGILPVGVCKFHVSLSSPKKGRETNVVYTVEVPNSPFHTYAPFDPVSADQV